MTSSELLIDSLTTVVRVDPTAIVLLLSDHGQENTRFDWAAPEALALVDRASVLLAARTPGHRDVFPDDITLVNALPRLFDHLSWSAGVLIDPDDVPVVGVDKAARSTRVQRR